MLTDIQAKLKGLVRQTWAADVQEWGERVALYRQYAAGEHRARLTENMRTMLRVSDVRTDRFNANYCGLVSQAMSDRLVVTAIEGGEPKATEWAKGVMESNRFDSLQMDIHEDMLISGDTFLMQAWSEMDSMVVWAHEPAYDGDVGIIPVYDRLRRNLVAAVKIWWEGDARRVNFYTPGKIEKYIWEGTAEEPTPKLRERDGAARWADNKDAALGVPLIHFKNRPSTYAWHGESELVNAIPLQDVLNRTITSMVMTSELSAFQIRVARGFTPPPQVQPGMWLIIGEGGLEKDQIADVDVMEQAQLVPFIDEANFIIDQISSVTQTPLLSSMGGSSSSGEALKQREVGLIGKVKRAQTRTGNAWEDSIRMASRIQAAYGTAAQDSKIWRAKWQDASPRNDTDVIANALAVREIVGDQETLRLVGPVFNYDEKKIRDLMAEKDEDAAKTMNQLNLPGFEQFGANTDLRQDAPALPAAANPNNAQVLDPAAIEAALAQIPA
jgi:hypothetical protein